MEAGELAGHCGAENLGEEDCRGTMLGIRYVFFLLTHLVVLRRVVIFMHPGFSQLTDNK